LEQSPRVTAHPDERPFRVPIAAVGKQDKTYERQTLVVFDRGESLYRLGRVQDLAQMGCTVCTHGVSSFEARTP
jgi:hypothetical protein